MTIELIPDDAVDLLPEPPEFVTLATQELGNAATPDDGFDGIMFEAVTNLAGTAPALDDSASAEHDALQAFPELQQDEASPVRLDLADALTEGEAILTDFGVDMGTIEPPPPDPPPPPPPPSGGPGGGTGGGGGTGVGSGPLGCPEGLIRVGNSCLDPEA